MQSSKTKINKKSKSKFIIIAVGLVLIVFLTITFVKILDWIKFGGSLGDNKLLIIQSPWTGWSMIQPSDTKKIFDITDVNIIDLYDMSIATSEETSNMIDLFNKAYLHISSFNDNEVSLWVTNLSVKEGEEVNDVHINLNACGMHSFTLKKGETAELNTCTMDGGTSWTIKY